MNISALTAIVIFGKSGEPLHSTDEITELQETWNELGEKGVSFEILDILGPQKDDSSNNYTKDLTALEELWLEKLQPYDERGYNKIKPKKE